MSSDSDAGEISVEIELENNVAVWLQQMVITISIAVAVLAFFEVRGGIEKNIIAVISVILLFLTAIAIGALSSVSYYKRRKKLIKDGVLNKSAFNNWYFIVGILTIISFAGITTAVIILKKKYNSGK